MDSDRTSRKKSLAQISVRVESGARDEIEHGGFHFTALPPLALYVHIPWCVRKCPYCDFNSHEAKGALPEAEYIDALILDLEHDLPRVWGRKVSSIFIGGGTPSLFAPESIDRLLSAVRARLPLLPTAEITLEANPGTVEQGRFAEYRAAGVNRLSIGVQSFQDDLLQRLGRIHGGREAVRAAEQAHAAGFDNFNLDLMFGLPQQTVTAALADVATAMDLEPSHLSFYHLTIEPNTYFYKHTPELPPDDLAWRMQEECQAQLAQRSYAHYEVSAYARDGKQCAHNLNYWKFGDYLGIGAGAHAKISDAQAQSIRRLWKIKNPRDYMSAVARSAHIGGDAPIGVEDAPLEFMMNALRLIDGVELSLFRERTGLAPDLLEPMLNHARERGLLDADAQRLRATAHGQRYLNDLLEIFVPV